MSLSVVIPNYNGEEVLKNNLPKVIKAVGDAQIIVVDDASSDSSLNVLDSFGSKLKVIRSEENSGFSSTVNRGVEAAKGDIVILLNTDVIPERDFLSPLLYHFKDGRVFAVGCMDKSMEEGKTVLRGRGVGVWKRGFLIHSRGEVNKKNTLWVSGGSGAFRKSIWDKLGGFSEFYNPFYWEDIDLSYRALKSGYKVVFEPKSIVIHEHEKGAIKKTYSPFHVRTIAYRNQFIFVWKNATELNLKLSHLFWLPYHFIKAFIRADLAFFEGFFAAFILLPKVIKSSQEDQKLFLLKDSQIVFPFKGKK